MIPYFALAAFLVLLYSQTIAPGYTWARFSADSGDLVSAVIAGGVPHPGGYPLYLILSHPFQYLPFHSPAVRFHVFSLTCVVVSALVLYTYLLRHVSKFIAFSSALIYATLPAIWSQALMTEVYALHLMMVSIFLLLLDMDNKPRLFFPLGVFLGLSASNHLTSFLLVPLVLYKRFESPIVHTEDKQITEEKPVNSTAFNPFASFAPRLFRFNYKKAKTFPSKIFPILIGILLGLTPYLILPFRAATNPPINWGNASTFNGFFWLISGRLYQSYATSLAWADIIHRLRAFAGLFLDQFTFVGVLLVLYGLFLQKPRIVLFTTAWTALTFTSFAIFFGSFDSHVNLLVVWLCFTIWLAFSLQDLFAALPLYSWAQNAAGIILFILLAFRIQNVYLQADLSQDLDAEIFIANAAQTAPQNAIILASGDAPLFSLWYMQYALGQRPDLVLVSDGLLQFDWYLDTLKNTYPQLELPAQNTLQPFDLIVANPTRRICYAKPETPIYCP